MRFPFGSPKTNDSKNEGGTVEVSGTGTGTSNPVGGAVDTSATGADDITTDAGEGDSPTETNLVPSTPPISIATPTLRKENLLVYNQDESGCLPVFGKATDAGYVAVSESPFEVTACLEKKDTNNNKGWSMIRTAYANTMADTMPAVCDEDYVACCEVLGDGSFNCFYDGVDKSVGEVNVVALNEDGDMGENVVEPVQANLLYTAAAADDLGMAGGNLYSLSGGSGIRITPDDEGQLRVNGDYETGYQNFTANGTRLAYSATDTLAGVMGGATGIQLLDASETGMVDTTEVATDINATAYTFMRPINGILYYGFEQESSTEAYLNFATTKARLDDDPEKYKKIYIIKPDNGGDQIDTDDDGTPDTTLHHTRTVGWDSVVVGADTWTVGVFEDDANNLRLRLVYKTGSGASWRLDGNIWKTTSDVNIKDIAIYYDDDSSVINFAILDETNSKVWIGRYNTSGTRVIDSSRAISVGANPIAMTYSTASGNLYVLNQGTKSVSVINLVGDGVPVNTPSVTSIIDLSNFAEGKTIDHVLTSILLDADKLLIGDTTTKAIMVVDVSAYE